MLDNFLALLIIIPFILLLWISLILICKVTLDEFGISFYEIFNRKVVDIPDFVNAHRNSEIEYLFNERSKNDNEIQI